MFYPINKKEINVKQTNNANWCLIEIWILFFFMTATLFYYYIIIIFFLKKRGHRYPRTPYRNYGLVIINILLLILLLKELKEVNKEGIHLQFFIFTIWW